MALLRILSIHSPHSRAESRAAVTAGYSGVSSSAKPADVVGKQVEREREGEAEAEILAARNRVSPCLSVSVSMSCVFVCVCVYVCAYGV